MQAALQPDRAFAWRTSAAIAAVLVLSIGLTLGQIGSLVAERAPADSGGFGSSGLMLSVAQEFYGGLNSVLETGDPAQETRVAPGFVDHLPNGQANRSWSESADALLDLRADWPELQLRVTALNPIGDEGLLKATLAFDAGHPAEIPGLPLHPPDSAAIVEYLAISGRAVTDRWNAAPAIAATTYRLDAKIGWNAPLTVMAAIEHVTLAPYERVELRIDQPIMVRVESGAVRFDRASTDLGGDRIPTGTPVETGETRVADGGGVLIVRNDGDDPAELSLFDTSASLASDDNVVALAAIPLNFNGSAMDGITSRLSAVHLTLPPGAAVDAHAPGRVQAIAVLDGSIEVTVENGRALEFLGEVRTRTFGGTVLVDAGHGVSSKGNTTLSYRANGARPASLLVFTIDPA